LTDPFKEIGIDGRSNAASPSARELALEEAARNLVAVRYDTYKARNGKLCSIEGDDGEKAWIVPFDAMAELESALSPDHADAVRERAWYFSAGDTVPKWLEKVEKGNCTLTFGVDVVVTSKDGGYEVRPQGIADNAGPILHVVNQGNVTPEIKGGGNGVAIIGYNRPYDETAEGKIERLKRLLEMARPYVECYDTREHNAEQDAVLTEIDKALSVLTEGDHIAYAGKVEGDGKPVAYLRPKDIERLAKPGVSGAINVQIANVPFIGCTVPVFAALPSAPASEGAE